MCRRTMYYWTAVLRGLWHRTFIRGAANRASQQEAGGVHLLLLLRQVLRVIKRKAARALCRFRFERKNIANSTLLCHVE
jgi:hypothetical protein